MVAVVGIGTVGPVTRALQPLYSRLRWRKHEELRGRVPSLTVLEVASKMRKTNESNEFSS